MQSTSSVAILGIPVDNVTMDDVLLAVEKAIHDGGFHQFATANVDFLINSIHDSELKEILCHCDMVMPDGMPLVWASRWMGTSLQERVSGSDLVPRLAELSSWRGYRIFLLGSSEDASRNAAAWMISQYPGTNIVGRYCPDYMPLEDMDHEEILSRIEAANPEILLVAFGNPKQEKWLAMHRHRLRVPVCIGIGGSLDLLAGRLTRAPIWMRDSGFEWFYRMCQEPARLAARYAGNALGLLRYLPSQLAANAAQKRRDALNQITARTVGAATVVRVCGALTSLSVMEFENFVRGAVESGTHVVLDLSATTYIGPDALGTLIHVGAVARRYSRELWLTGLRSGVSRVVRATQLGSAFRTAPRVTDALRRIGPAELRMSIESGQHWGVCRIGGRSIPLSNEQAQGLCQQILQFLEGNSMGNLARNPIPTATQGD